MNGSHERIPADTAAAATSSQPRVVELESQLTSCNLVLIPSLLSMHNVNLTMTNANLPAVISPLLRNSSPSCVINSNLNLHNLRWSGLDGMRKSNNTHPLSNHFNMLCARRKKPSGAPKKSFKQRCMRRKKRWKSCPSKQRTVWVWIWKQQWSVPMHGWSRCTVQPSHGRG